MTHPDNYAIMADNTRKLFLTYDQSQLLANIPMTHDEAFFYLPILSVPCRVHRQTGQIDWQTADGWARSTSPNDAIALFDYLCDAKPGRILAGEFRAVTGFGHQFHTSLAEPETATPLERYIDAHPDEYRAACEALGGKPHPMGDIGYTLMLFPDLPVLLQFWHSDEDFPAQLRIFWDGNSLDWLRYETMYYAQGIIRSRLAEKIGFPQSSKF